MQSLGIIALTPGISPEALSNPSLEIAAARAGAAGVLDVEYLDDCQAILSAVKTLRRQKGTLNFGIKCNIAQIRELSAALTALASPGQGNIVILTGAWDSGAAALAQSVRDLRDRGLKVLAEVTSVEQGLVAQAAGADAVIAKGHESGGLVGELTTFVLVQGCIRQLVLPVWAHGGIGLNTAAAVFAAGAAGIVLDSQLALLRESQLPLELKARIARLDGTETTLIGGPAGQSLRLLSSPVSGLPLDTPERGGAGGDWHASICRQARERLASRSPLERLWTLGQDAALAAPFARRFSTVAAVVQYLQESVVSQVKSAAENAALAEASPLALSHGTAYPIVQGAMTRVSDSADFALAVAQGGGMPFLALGLMRAGEIEELLCKTKEKLGGLPWGVGLLGFIPSQLREEQLSVVKRYRPRLSLIAGGRPDQGQALEELGIETYLHVPSAILLASFVETGARRFIFEGKEAGGHVGPRSSFVLWESMIDVLLSAIPAKESGSSYHVLFAGGVHDDLSAAMVAAMAAPLTARGIKVGVLVGTAYLFTEEAVSSGAIVKKFQDAALACRQTVLLETSPGHAIRCIDSPYRQTFDEQRQLLESQRQGRDEIRQKLELMNLGRLRLASKGLEKAQAEPGMAPLVPSSEERQWQGGMYMVGQIAALRDTTVTIASLHDNISRGSGALLERVLQNLEAPPPEGEVVLSADRSNEAIAIIGMSCLLPKSRDVEEYWQNILDKTDTIEEIPESHWPYEYLYDADPLKRDKIVSKWGGFLQDVPFKPGRYGIPPSSLASIDPMQLLILEAAHSALADAGYGKRKFPRETTSVILANAGHGPTTALYSLRSMLGWKLSDLDDEAKRKLEDRLPEWTEDSFAGYLGNVAAGRVANRFDLGGINFAIDAACASSLAALYAAVSELRSGISDVVLLGATDTHNNPGDYLSFSKTHALSPGGRCRTFDATADGIVISEGIAMVVLKRLSDAERDGDRVYAVIRGIGGSSDGRDLSLTAPRPAGQMKALCRAYKNAGICPSTIELIEAHGTGTVAGDRAEIEALQAVFGSAGARAHSCAVGSVKTNIGHTKAAAGLASLIKVAKALHHKILPPTIGVKVPSPACNFASGPLYLNTEALPWVRFDQSHPRRAGVSAFGFGGTNFHAVLEEYVPASVAAAEPATRAWAGELFLFRGSSRKDLLRALSVAAESSIKVGQSSAEEELSASKQTLDRRKLFELAAATCMKSGERRAGEGLCLAIVATSIGDLKDKIERAQKMLADESCVQVSEPDGIYFASEPLGRNYKTAFLFPGQGSQKLEMLKDLSFHFPEIIETFEHADRVLGGRLPRPLSKYIFPPPSFVPQEHKGAQEALTNTHVAQPAVGAADVAVFRLLSSFNIKADLLAGHSYGEYVALHAAGVLSVEDLFSISESRGRIFAQADLSGSGTMAAVAAPQARLQAALQGVEGVTIANVNSPQQCVISGAHSAVDQALSRLREAGIAGCKIAVSAAFHSPLMATSREKLAGALSGCCLKSPSLPVYSNTTAAVHESNPESIARQLVEHTVSPVNFVGEVEAMWEAGARVFVEVGPGTVLSGLVQSILEGKEHVVVAVERSGKNGLLQFLHALAVLASQGLPLDIAPLYVRRVQEGHYLKPAGQEAFASENGKKTPSLLYRVNSARVERVNPPVADRASITSLMGKAVLPDPPAYPITLPPAVVQRFKTESPGRGSPSSGTRQMPEVLTPVSENSCTQPSAVPPGAGSSRAQPAFKFQTQSDDKVFQGESVAARHNSSHVRSSEKQPGLKDGPMNNGGNGNGKPAGSIQITGAAGQGAAPQLAAPFVSQPPLPGHQGAGSVEQVMIQFQKTMLEMTTSFLEAQQNVMLAYLQASNMPPQASACAQPTVVSGATQILVPPLMCPPQAERSAVQAGQGEVTTRKSLGKSAAGSVPPLELSVPQPDGGEERTHPGEGFDANADSVVPVLRVNDAGSHAAGSQGFASARQRQEAVGSNESKDGSSRHSRSRDTGDNPNCKNDEVSAEALVAGLLDIVSERTGYPQDMLDPALDLEGDLGIDSIKRVEILNSFRKLLPPATQKSLEGNLEGLAGTKTLQGIIDWIHTDIAGSVSQAASGTVAAENWEDVLSQASKISRGLTHVIELPPSLEQDVPIDGAILISDDGDGIGEGLAALLSARGYATVVARHHAGVQDFDLENLQADLTSAEAVGALVDAVKARHGKVGALIHLAALQQAKCQGEFSPVEAGVTGLFLLCKYLEGDLRACAAGKRSAVLSATALGGCFGVDGLEAAACSELASIGGGVVGVLKSVAREWPEVHARAVDFQPSVNRALASEMLLCELFSADKVVEVGYRGGRRLGLEVVAADFSVGSSRADVIRLTSSSVVLVTGGARGITADIALELAQRYRPHFVIVGRLARPQPIEESETAALTSVRDIKAAIMRRLTEGGQPVTVSSVESKYQRLMREREIRGNLSLLESTGATVSYHSLDVRDEQAFGAFVDGLYETYGSIDAVIHGAGIIEDALIKDKTPESFARVFQTKVRGAFVLARKLRLDSLKLLLFFSSVVGRTGNAGQADYVAANEVLNKLALYLDQLTPGRVASLMWGPWNGGMAQVELSEVFARHGWSMIAPSCGRAALTAELQAGGKGQVEVLLVGKLDGDQGKTSPTELSGRYLAASSSVPNSLAEAQMPGSELGLAKGEGPSSGLVCREGPDEEAAVPVASGPRLSQSLVSVSPFGQVDFEVALDVRQDIYLEDHKFDGIPVLPMAMALEMMAEAAMSVFSNLDLLGVVDLDIPSGIVFDSSLKTVIVSVGPGERRDGKVLSNVGLSTVTSSGQRKTHFKAVFEMAEAPLAVPREAVRTDRSVIPANFAVPDLLSAEVNLPPVAQIYDSWLFHGPIFQGISCLIALGENGIAGDILPSQPTQCLSTASHEPWIIDPIALDAAMQLAGVWARKYLDITVLPTGFARLHYFRRGGGKVLTAQVFLPPGARSNELLCDLAVYGEDGRLCLLIEGLGGIGNKSLNRFGSQPKRLPTAR